MNRTGKNYDDMTLEELQQEFREAFFETDIIDDTVNDELEELQDALCKKRPVEFLHTPDESWEHFLIDRAEELEPFFSPEVAAEAEEPKANTRTVRMRAVPTLLRRVLIAAVVVVLLAGAALAANSLGLAAWVRGWNENTERYAQTGSGSPGPILEALEELGITESVYPAWLPKNYVLTEAHISKDPLLLYELYTKADRFISITITPISAVDTALYSRKTMLEGKKQPGKPAHYIFSNDESITVVWYTDNYFTSMSSNITAGAMERIIESVYTGNTKGGN